MAYRGTEAYDFSLFEPQVIEQPKKKQTGKAAPAKKNVEPQKKTEHKKAAPKKTEATRKPVSKIMDNYGTEVERNAQMLVVPASVKRFFCFAVVCICLMVVFLVMNTKCDALLNEIAQVENDIEIAEGENVRLNAEISSKISTDKIDNYAVDVLGMVKAENYQIYYVDLSEGDEIVLSGEKTTEDESEVESKIKELFAYIF